MAIRRSMVRRPTSPTYIEVSGFKSIRDPVRVEIRKLTILAGENSSGKSAIMQLPLMLKQTLEATYDPGPLLLDGPHAKLTRLSQFFSRGKKQSDTADTVTLTLGPIQGSRPSRRGAKANVSEVRLSFRAKSKRQDNYGLAPVETSVRLENRWVTIEDGMSRADIALLIAETGQMPMPEDLDIEVFRTEEHFATSIAVSGRPKGKSSDSAYRAVFRVHISPVDAYTDWLSMIFHLPGLRGHRDRLYPAARIDTGSRGAIAAHGPFTAYVASFLEKWRDNKRTDSNRLDQVNDGLRRLGLTWKVQASRVDATQVELKVGRTAASAQGGAHDLVDLADVGFGVSQVLPVLVALAAASPGQTVYVEQPELHLHPRAQVALGAIIAEKSAKGIIVILETHSKLLLRSIQTAVARGMIPSSDVSLHWFSRDPETGFTRVSLADLDSNGAWGEWPADFSDIDDSADVEWLEAAFGNSQ